MNVLLVCMCVFAYVCGALVGVYLDAATEVQCCFCTRDGGVLKFSDHLEPVIQWIKSYNYN